MQRAPLLLLAITLASCHHTFAKEDTVDVTLDWKLSKHDNVLHLDYTFTNRTAVPVHVWDQMVVPKDPVALVPTAVIVARGDKAGDVRFVKGDVQPASRVNIKYPPGLRTVAPGASVTGVGEAPLPLAAWHPYGAAVPLDGTPAEGVLEVQYIVGDVKTNDGTLPDGSAISRPASIENVKTVRSRPLPLP